MPELHELLGRVSDRESFLVFVDAVIVERKNADAQDALSGWQNDTIEQYLESAAAWTKDSAHSFSSENPWRNFAEFLYMGKMYE
jgi:hypothetical protein